MRTPLSDGDTSHHGLIQKQITYNCTRCEKASAPRPFVMSSSSPHITERLSLSHTERHAKTQITDSTHTHSGDPFQRWEVQQRQNSPAVELEGQIAVTVRTIPISQSQAMQQQDCGHDSKNSSTILLPYGLLLSTIFKHFQVDLSGEEIDKMGKPINTTNLKKSGFLFIDGAWYKDPAPEGEHVSFPEALQEQQAEVVEIDQEIARQAEQQGAVDNAEVDTTAEQEPTSQDMARQHIETCAKQAIEMEIDTVVAETEGPFAEVEENIVPDPSESATVDARLSVVVEETKAKEKEVAQSEEVDASDHQEGAVEHISEETRLAQTPNTIIEEGLEDLSQSVQEIPREGVSTSVSKEEAYIEGSNLRNIQLTHMLRKNIMWNLKKSLILKGSNMKILSFFLLSLPGISKRKSGTKL
ncbi:hypothetical protein Taro_035752 [Colocasia esculenta]|uniref:Uncharacterized protein n=1 Tax=Colocasia esculenta TaxID=4460 RepID=A0A843WBE3_COLES|nr:hypothetical protein [Colocasia esculenta]